MALQTAPSTQSMSIQTELSDKNQIDIINNISFGLESTFNQSPNKIIYNKPINNISSDKSFIIKTNKALFCMVKNMTNNQPETFFMDMKISKYGYIIQTLYVKKDVNINLGGGVFNIIVNGNKIYEKTNVTSIELSSNEEYIFLNRLQINFNSNPITYEDIHIEYLLSLIDRNVTVAGEKISKTFNTKNSEYFTKYLDNISNLSSTEISKAQSFRSNVDNINLILDRGLVNQIRNILNQQSVESSPSSPSRPVQAPPNPKIINDVNSIIDNYNIYSNNIKPIKVSDEFSNMKSFIEVLSLSSGVNINTLLLKTEDNKGFLYIISKQGMNNTFDTLLLSLFIGSTGINFDAAIVNKQIRIDMNLNFIKIYTSNDNNNAILSIIPGTPATSKISLIPNSDNTDLIIKMTTGDSVVDIDPFNFIQMLAKRDSNDYELYNNSGVYEKSNTYSNTNNQNITIFNNIKNEITDKIQFYKPIRNTQILAPTSEPSAPAPTPEYNESLKEMYSIEPNTNNGKVICTWRKV